MMKLLTAAAFTFALTTGAAFAQLSAPANSGEDARAPNTETLGTFYTDDTMTELRSTDEIRTSWNNLSGDERQNLMNMCSLTTAEGGQTTIDDQTTASIEDSDMPQNMADLCEQVNAWGNE